MATEMKILEEWKTIFEDFKESKMSIQGYCNKNHISRDKFRYWKYKLELTGYKFASPYAATHEAIKVGSNNFIEINISNITSVEKKLKITVKALTITLDPQSNIYFIKKLIKELESFI